MYTIVMKLNGHRDTRGLFHNEAIAWRALCDVTQHADTERYVLNPIADKMAYCIKDTRGQVVGSIGIVRA